MNNKKNIINYIIIGFSAVILVCYIVFVDGIDNILKAFSSKNISWMLGAVVCIILYWLFETIVLHSVTKSLFPQQKFYNTFKTTMIGQLFNCITPCASGGQPMQAFHMTKCNVPLGIASSSLLSRFIVYQVVLTMYSTFVLIFKFKFFSNKISSFGFLVFIGFIINTAVVVMLLCVGFFPSFARKASYLVIKICHKIHIIKDKEKSINYIDNEIDQFYNSFLLVKKNFKLLLVMFLFSALQLTAFFMVPYFVCLAMGVSVNIINIIAASAFVLMVSSFVPLPGAAGGAEGSFYIFFGMFFHDHSDFISIAILLWRIITFYLPIAVGTCFSAKFTKNKVD